MSTANQRSQDSDHSTANQRGSFNVIQAREKSENINRNARKVRALSKRFLREIRGVWIEFKIVGFLLGRRILSQCVDLGQLQQLLTSSAEFPIDRYSRSTDEEASNRIRSVGMWVTVMAIQGLRLSLSYGVQICPSCNDSQQSFFLPATSFIQSTLQCPFPTFDASFAELGLTSRATIFASES